MSTTVESGTEIRPFNVDVPEQQIDDLRRRIAQTRWPSKELVADRSQGVQLATMQELARYWATDYDWRAFEKRFAALPHFVTEIDGVDIHFIHVRSEHEDALPLVVTHGWPGSTVEQLKIIDPLTEPPSTGRPRPMPSTSSSPRCPATGSPGSRPRPAGTPSASRGPGSS